MYRGNLIYDKFLLHTYIGKISMETLIVLGICFLLGVTIATTLTLFVGVFIAIGIGLSVVGIGTGVFSFFKEDEFEEKLIALAFTGAGGLLLGASIGAIIGSAVPGIGTLLGAVVGSLIGLIVPVVGLVVTGGLIASVNAVSSSISTFSYKCSSSYSTQPSSYNHHQSPNNFFSSKQDSHYPESSSNTFRPR